MNIKQLYTLGMMAITALTSTQAFANNQADQMSPFMDIGSQTSAPIGHAEFCQKQPEECHARFTTPAIVELTEELWKELLNINAMTNSSIQPITDMDLYNVIEKWTYPEKAGDCEDYVLMKRRMLINQGWPASALLITVVRESTGEGHAVLTVRTDRGDLILDNQEGRVLLWSQTNYAFVKRQSSFNEQAWVSVLDPRNYMELSQN